MYTSARICREYCDWTHGPGQVYQGLSRSCRVSGPALRTTEQAHTSQCTLAMNNENTEEMITRAAHRIGFGVPANEVADGLRAEGNSDEVVFLVITAAQLLAK